MLKYKGESIQGKTVTVSGSGNVAQYAVEKCNHLGAKAVTLSDSSGWIHDPDGINEEKLNFVLELKNERRGRIKEYADKYGVEYFSDGRVWKVPCDVALPCATQNEVDEEDAQTLVKNGCKCVSEGANMPTTPKGVDVFLNNNVLYGLGKAANAGGVAVSGLEMSQNSMRLSWTREEVDQKLHGIMQSIHEACVTTAEEFGTPGNYVNGANIAGFIKVADAMLDLGVI
jgi:glutamate dehydrogenase/leucine dehydrogenase